MRTDVVQEHPERKVLRAQPLTRHGAAWPSLVLRRSGLQDYQATWRAMRSFVDHAAPGIDDEIWLLSHPPVYTQGQAGRAEHVLDPGGIPVLRTDRGGQVTYHGPGQLVAYLLLDLRRRKLGARGLVELLERALLATLATFGIEGEVRQGAPGVYVNGAKIAALGLRIRRGWSYHGLSLNVNVELAPFANIHPCGFRNLAVTRIADHCADGPGLPEQVEAALGNSLLHELGYAPLLGGVAGRLQPATTSVC